MKNKAEKNTPYTQALSFVQKKHRGQKRAGGMPVWHHLLRVSQLLEYVLTLTNEGTPKERSLIVLSALGHDLLEDTKAKEDEISVLFGKEGLKLIKGMTNTLGDRDHGPYVQHMVETEEAIRLIKLSDLYDNITSVTYNLTLLGEKWTTSFFLPIVIPMHQAVKTTKFPHYKKHHTSSSP
ncbi:MAG: HD domain-containing protein [Parcubacteria group bacterium]|nr:HD domain-containing protein [Parcubacteria group bacterium]